MSQTGAEGYLEAGHLPSDGLAQLGHGVQVLQHRHHVVVPDHVEAVVLQQLLSDPLQAGLQLGLHALVHMGAHQDDGRQRGHRLEGSRGYARMEATVMSSNNPLSMTPAPDVNAVAFPDGGAVGPGLTLMLNSQGLSDSTWAAPLLTSYTTR